MRRREIRVVDLDHEPEATRGLLPETLERSIVSHSARATSRRS